ncbi:MAG: hypothetical protein ACHP78_10615 [Terriglobales bacterium]
MEPNDNDKQNPNWPRKKWISGGLVFLLAFGYGFFALREKSTERRANLRQEGHRIATENAELRAKLREVGSQDTPTMDAYVQKCMQLEPLVIAAQNAQNVEADYFVRAEREYRDNPAVSQTLSFLARMRDKDRQGLAVLAEEISRAKQVKLMPGDEQRILQRANRAAACADSEAIR